MFVIPCKYSEQNPIIFECVSRIRQYQSEERILIVDSASEDKSYFDRLEGVEIADINNVHYGTNAFKFAFDNYLEEQFFYCIYDSLLLNNSLKHIKTIPLTVVRHFFSPPTGIGWNSEGISLSVWANQQMNTHMGIGLPDIYTGVMGPMLMCNRSVLKDLSDLGFFSILPTNKYELCAMERILGCALSHLGYRIEESSLQGEMVDFFGQYDNTYVEKVNIARW
jgi:hypothetical protein